MSKTKVLFVCSGNIDRSPTAEEVFKARQDLEVKSAGTSILARRRITKEMIQWADKIFVMEEKHAERIRSMDLRAAQKTVVLKIPDVYHRNDPELKQLLIDRVTPHLP